MYFISKSVSLLSRNDLRKADKQLSAHPGESDKRQLYMGAQSWSLTPWFSYYLLSQNEPFWILIL